MAAPTPCVVTITVEWLGQHKQGVYDFSVVREYDHVVAEAKREGKEVHMARVHSICVEKNYQWRKGSPRRTRPPDGQTSL